MISSAPLPSIPASVPGQSGSGAGTALLALDLGTCTGWALRERGGRICSGSQPFRPQRFEGGGMRFLRFHRWLTELSQASEGSAAPLPVGSWLFIPRRRTTTPVTTAISSAAAATVVLYTPETLAAHLGVTLATLENWRLSGYGPAWFQLGELIRYSATDVDAWLALQFEQAQG